MEIPLCPPEAPDSLELAMAARLRARDGLLDSIAQGAHVRQITEHLMEHARKNHFGEGLENAWRRRA